MSEIRTIPPQLTKNEYSRVYFQLHKNEIYKRQKEWRIKNPDKVKEEARRNWHKIKARCEEYFGDSCYNCGRSGVRLVKHEINFINHNDKRDYRFFWNNKERFILLCDPHCHCTFHQLHEVGYSIEEILKILKWEEVNNE